MKIALVVEWLDPWRGGAETSTGQFLRHLVDLGVDVEVFTRSRSASAPGLTIHTVRSSSTSRIRSSTLFPHRAAAAVRRRACDLVHSIVPCPVADLYQPRGGTVAETIERNIALRRSEAARRWKRLVNRFNVKQRSRLRLERALLERSQRPVVVAISDYVVRQLVDHYGFPMSHIRKVFNGVDRDTTGPDQRRADRAEIRRLHHVAEHEPLAILVAHNFRLKGVRRWIEAMAVLRQRDRAPLWSLVIGRQSPIRWQKLAERFGVADRLHFAGPTQRIQAYYHAADFLIHPTYYDPCSRVVLESLASQLPCVTTRFDGASEVIENGVNGFVIDSPDDVNAIAERALALTDGVLCRRLARNTLASVDGITMRRHAEQMVGVYEKILSDRRRS